MDKVTYSTDTTTALPSSANLSSARYVLAATETQHGYFGGGFLPMVGNNYGPRSYASDTTAAVSGASLSDRRSQLAATGNSTHGYFGGGEGFLTLMDKLTYSSDTTAAFLVQTLV